MGDRLSVSRIATTLATGLVFLAAARALAADAPLGSVSVTVVDAVTKAPIEGATVRVAATSRGAYTDAGGKASIGELPAASYSLTLSCIGYEQRSLADIIIRPQRITFVEAELPPRLVEAEGLEVTAPYFSQPVSQPTSTTGFSSEEIRRSPGSAGDVSRIVGLLPSLAKVNDQLNNLVVRGGSPAENAFYLDNIEIANINHYPVQGASGGPIGLLNVDFLRSAEFSAGGFSALYGDRLSSVMELEYREGDRTEFDGQLDFHFAGIGAAVEGPLSRGRGSYMLSARRSYLDLLVGAIGTGVAPRYSDYQGKAVYDLGPATRISLLGVGGKDFIELTKEQSRDDGNVVYGTSDGHEYAVGSSLLRRWGTHGYSKTSLSILSTTYGVQFYETKSDSLLVRQHTRESSLQLRNVNTWELGKRAVLELGIEGKYHFDRHRLATGEYTNAIGDTVPPLVVHTDVDAVKVGSFASLTLGAGSRVSSTLGLRYDHFDYVKRSHLSPRLAGTLALSSRTSLTVATGVYFQSVPLSILVQKPENRALRDPRAYHGVVGVSHLLSDNTRLTVEAYVKSYAHFPMDVAQPQFFAADGFGFGGPPANYERLVDEGRARSFGVETVLQKKLVAGLYGLACGSYSRAEYRGLDGLWRDRAFDNRFIVGLEGGLKPNNRWELSLRWIYAGGAPYTPLDLDASRAINRTVLDGARVNAERFPDYHSLNLRVDRRFLYQHSNLIAYFSIWNVYNRKNVAGYFWNEIEQAPDTVHQWGFLPVAGFEYEF